jgi:thioredoxin reductase (NADPH)
MQSFSAHEHGSGLLVVCFCAAWCDTCDGVRAALERMAARDTANSYIWLDIEDDAALMGDIEVENFPTFAIYSEGRPLFFGVSPPQEGVIVRTLAAFASGDARTIEVPEAVLRLPGMLIR